MSIYSTQLLRTPTVHRASVTSICDSLWNGLSEGFAATTSSWIPQFAKSIVVGALSKIKHGRLYIVTDDEILKFGDHESKLLSELTVTLRLRRRTFWTRVLLFKDLGFAEAFMYGDVDCDEIHNFLRLYIVNRRNININTFASSLLTLPQFLTSSRFVANLSNSRANVSAHYDIGDTLFSAFLSEDMNYSCGIFKNYTEDLQPGAKNLETLEDAQLRKMRNIIYRANIRKGDRVLEIGTGWGSFCILATQETGCTVETLTLSAHQKAFTEERIRAAGLSDKITVHLMDYRDCKLRPEWEHYFDRFVSIEMMEHVGKDFMEEYWEVADWVLNTTDAVGCVQVTTLPEARVAEYDQSVDFIQKWVFFPGAYIPSCVLLVSTLTSGTDGRLTIDDVANIGPQYARTLREWKRKFLGNFDSIIASALRKEHQLTDADLEILKRKWIYYFDYCESGFATRLLGVHIITFTREGNVALGCTLSDY